METQLESVLRRAGREAGPIRFSRTGVTEFHRLLDNLPMGAYMCDPEGLITYFNSAAVAAWGRSPRLNEPEDRFCGSFKLFSPDGTAIRHDQCWMALALTNRTGYNGQPIIVERPDGRRVTVLAYANPIYDDAGKLLGAVNVLVDITDRQRAVDALREADRSKDEFLATLAHELRNPLGSIHNAVHVMQAPGVTADESQTSLGVICRQLRHLTRLVDDLMDISRIKRNKLDLQIEQVDISTILKAAVETTQPLITSAGHELTVTLPSQPVMVRGDATRLTQIFSALLNNAAKYTEPEGQIWLTAQRQGSDIYVTVRDSGIGIPPNVLPQIFEMFMQVDASAPRSQGGLGIGLTLAKRLVELHGGTIQARSGGLGKGTEFAVRLPVPVTTAEKDAAIAPRMERAGGANPLRVVVADDNQDSSECLGMVLRLAGNEVWTAKDGIEAVAAAERCEPDVILLDIGMPGMDGYEAARHIRNKPARRRPILIALTGWGQDEDRERSKNAGIDYHLVKPVAPDALLKLLATVKPRSDDPTPVHP